MQFFRRLILILAVAAGISLPTASCYASNMRLLIGADYVNSDVKYRHIKTTSSNNINRTFAKPDDDYQSVSPTIGISAFGIGLEAFFLNSKAIKEDSIEAKLRGYGIELVGEAGLSDNFSLVASIGLTEYTFITKQDNRKIEDDCSGPRIGIGLQYYLTRNLAIRGMYHYTLLNSGEDDFYDNISEFSIGLRLIF